jgi:hypothetical protein
LHFLDFRLFIINPSLHVLNQNIFGIKCPNLIDHGLILGCKWSVQHAPSLDTFSSRQFATPFFDCHDVVVNCCFLVTGLLSFFSARTLPIFSRMPTVGDCHMVMSISPSRLTVHACLGLGTVVLATALLWS